MRKQGFATVAEENIRGVLSVGAPIRDRSGKVLAALSVAFPKYLDAALTLQSVTPLVVAAAQRISRAPWAAPEPHSLLGARLSRAAHVFNRARPRSQSGGLASRAATGIVVDVADAH